MPHVARVTRARALALTLAPAATLAVFAGVACAQVIEGTVTYGERMALPVGAELEVTLADVSRADAPAETIATTRVSSPGVPPIRFRLPFTDMATSVLTRGAPTTLAKPLVGTTWRATELGGKPLTPQTATRGAHLVFETGGRVGGSDGCSTMTGSYELTGERVRFGQMAGTQMACLNSPGTERPFRDALSAAVRLALSGDRLELYDERGTRLAVFVAASQETTGSTRDPLAGTAWQLVRFQGGDGAVLTPDDRTKYTMAFDAKGSVGARVDCNRGRGTWTSSGPNQVQFGPLALTRAQCPPGSLHDQIVKQWGSIRGYVLSDGHLFLSLMADGGVYEFEPVGGQSGSFRSPVPPRGPAPWTCAQTGAPSDTLRVTLYPTQPSLVLLERGGVTKPAFQVRAASGTRYEGDDVLFWEAQGEATLNWMGVELTCKPS